MGECESTFEKEKELVEFFGYHLEDGKIRGSYSIEDANDKNVGYLIVENGKYHTYIDSDTIHYDCKGELTNWNCKGFEYELKGKGYVLQRLTKNDGPGICRVLNLHGNSHISFYATNSGSGSFNLFYRKEENEYKMNTHIEYLYSSGIYKFYDSIESEQLGIDKTYLIYSDNGERFNYNPNKKVRMIEIINREYFNAHKFYLDKPLDEFVKTHQRGLEFVSKMRKIINESIPHNGDVLDDLFDEATINMFHLNPFFPNYEKGKEKNR